MNQFTFTGKQRSVLGGFMVLGLICLVVTFFGDDAHHTRFWSNYLHNTVYFTGIAFISTFIIAAFMTAYAGWHTVVKRIWEAYSQFLIVGLLLFLLIVAGVFFGWHHLYHWADEAEVAKDPLLQGKAIFLNKYVYAGLTIGMLSVWYFIFARNLRNLSTDEDSNGEDDFRHHHRMRLYGAVFLPIGAFTSVIMIWQWIMSVDPHWYSTMFAWYTTASWFVAAIAMTILTIIWLKAQGYLGEVTGEHVHDLGKLMFAFSVFWTYLWFSQFMLIWYANIGEETIYFHQRRSEYPILFYGNLVMNFVLPFLILMRNSTKRKFGAVGFTAVLIVFSHWIDFFLMIKPGVYHTAHAISAHGAEGGHGHEAHGIGLTLGQHIPGILEIGTFLGFLALFLYISLHHLAKAKLVPAKDPYLEESLHHHV